MTDFFNNRYGTGRRYNRTAAVGGLVTEQLARLGIEGRVRQHLAPLVWAELVGPQVAAASEVEKVADGVLYVCTRSSTWAHELSFYKADILRRLNERLGARKEPLITDIRFLNRGSRRDKERSDGPPAFGPTPDELDDVDLSPREYQIIEDGIAQIQDETLRDRVRSARVAAVRLRTWRLDNGWALCPNCGELCPPSYPETGRVNCSRCRIERHRGR